MLGRSQINYNESINCLCSSISRFLAATETSRAEACGCQLNRRGCSAACSHRFSYKSKNLPSQSCAVWSFRSRLNHGRSR